MHPCLFFLRLTLERAGSHEVHHCRQPICVLTNGQSLRDRVSALSLCQAGEQDMGRLSPIWAPSEPRDTLGAGKWALPVLGPPCKPASMETRVGDRTSCTSRVRTMRLPQSSKLKAPSDLGTGVTFPLLCVLLVSSCHSVSLADVGSHAS